MSVPHAPTALQRAVLETIAARARRGVPPPTIREVAEALGGRAVATARDHLRALVRKGLVTPSDGRARSLRLTDAGWRALAPSPAPPPGGTDGASARGDLSQEALAVLLPYLEARRYRPGDVLWHEGDHAGLFVVPRTGRLRAFRTEAGGRAVTLYTFGPGDAFGFLPFLDGGPYPASVAALEDVEALVMSRTTLVRALAESSDVALTLIATLGRRLREALDRVEELTFRRAVQRVAAALLAMAPLTAQAPVVIDLPSPARRLAESVGVTPETLSRAITRFADEGLVHRLGPGRLQLLDGDALRGIAEDGIAEDRSA